MLICLLFYSPKLGRGKKKLKKLIGPLLMGLIGKKIFAIVPLLFVGLAVLAFKALIVSKIALLLAVVLTLTKGLGGLGGGGGGGGGGLGLLGKVAGLSGGLVGSGLLSGLSGGTGGGSAGNYANTGATGGGYSSGGSQSSGGWSSGGGNSGYPYARSYDVDAQDLAYSAQVQTE